jgi:hypothetical protein
MNAPTRRTLTADQMTAILHAIRTVDEPTALLPTVLAHVYDALLRHDGRRLADLKGSGRISPKNWQIPVTQWDAIAEAASSRAQAWGTDAQLRADLLDRMPGVFDEPAASTGTQPQNTGLRLLCVSVQSASACYLVGNPNVHPVEAVPPRIGTRFADLDAVKDYVRTELRGLGCYWQVRVVDDDGAVVIYGFRAGYNGTGETWTWRPAT